MFQRTQVRGYRIKTLARGATLATHREKREVTSRQSGFPLVPRSQARTIDTLLEAVLRVLLGISSLIGIEYKSSQLIEAGSYKIDGTNLPPTDIYPRK